MLNLYFQFFTSEIQKKSKLMNQKILLGLLTGVNRAFPFAHLENNDSISQNIDQLYKLVHHGTFIVGLQSLSLLYQAFNTKEELSDRFYNAVYRSGHFSELNNTATQSVILLPPCINVDLEKSDTSTGIDHRRKTPSNVFEFDLSSCFK